MNTIEAHNQVRAGNDTVWIRAVVLVDIATEYGDVGANIALIEGRLRPCKTTVNLESSMTGRPLIALHEGKFLSGRGGV